MPASKILLLLLQGRAVLVGVTVEVDDRRVRLFAVHAVSPYGSHQDWERSYDAIRQATAQEPGRRLLVGDFNATWGNRPFRSLLDMGLTDAAAARATPFRMTWPTHRLVPPIARIDHVLTGPGLAVTRIGLGTGRGSDHRPLLADVAVLAGAPARPGA